MEELYDHCPSKTPRQLQEHERHEREREEELYDEKMILVNRQPKNKIINNVIGRIPEVSSKDQARIIKSTTQTLLRDTNCTPDSDVKKWKQPKYGNEAQHKGKRIERKKVWKSETTIRCVNCGLPDHMTMNCPTKALGRKCFQCNEQGHIAENCKKQRAAIHPKPHSVRDCVDDISVDKNQERNNSILNSIAKVETPFDTYVIDYIGPMPSSKKDYQYIFIIIDAFSEYVWLYAMKTTNVKAVVNQLIKHSFSFGNPRRIISNVRKVDFASNDFTKYCKMENIEHLLITIGIPEVCEQAKHLNHVLIPLLTKLTSPKLKKWHKYLGLTQEYINSTLNRSTGKSPFYLLFGRPARLQDEVRELLEKEYNKVYQDKCDLECEEAKNIKIQSENKSDLLTEQAKENVKFQRENKNNLSKEQAKGNITKIQNENKSDLLREQAKKNVKLQRESKSDLSREQAKGNIAKIQNENKSDLLREQAKKNVKLQRETKSDLSREQAKGNIAKIQNGNKSNLLREQAKKNIKLQRENISDLFREQAKENVKIQGENKSGVLREQAKGNVKLPCENISDLFREQAKKFAKLQRENKSDLLREQAKGNTVKIQHTNESDFDKNADITTTYKNGDLVGIKRPQYAPDLIFTNEYNGPYEVTRVLPKNHYTVKGKEDCGRLYYTTAAAKFMKPWVLCPKAKKKPMLTNI